MSEHETSPRTTGATVLTLVAVACAAGLADVLRRRRERKRGSGHVEEPPVHMPHGTPTIPRQRRNGSPAEAVRLTEAERDAFAGLVRRFGEYG
ncbi:hypothetical protein [Streptomyces pilosus]|uniref:Uncharacterized protein n=1 Tax=Streptomyces pilosus TaxID=28893 RepID=A0A918C044_9ACTN|nr:hypothetical protein [Streptomyces pilosus]GGR00093.1 hypothetical protein GCM10010280_55170 [Streptomyces pilosus]GGV62996.1 hypothetical protein GCM10010261_52750 [Streptomyces pilosus]